VARHFIFYIRELWVNLSRNPLMTAAASGTSVISLLTLGISLIMVYNINNISSEITSQVEIRAFLKKDVGNYQIKDLQDKIMKIPQVRTVEYVSPERALDKLQEELDIDLQMAPDENPLPPALIIRVNNPNQIGAAADQIKEMPGVQDLLYGESIVQRLLAVSFVVKSIGYFMTLLMALGALFTIMNTIRLTVIARRNEIRTMQLVGATSWFIRWPFLLEGVVFGTVGALISTGIVSLGYILISAKLHSALPFIFPLVDSGAMVHAIFGILMLAGTVMGLAGSYISVSKFLVENPE
jgi:cell division transport system permease protein